MGYISFTTNFIILVNSSSSSSSNVTAATAAAAQIGILSEGNFQSASLTNSNSNWKHTPWIIACLVLFLLCICGFIFALGHLIWKRYTVVIVQPEGEPPQTHPIISTI